VTVKVSEPCLNHIRDYNLYWCRKRKFGSRKLYDKSVDGQSGDKFPALCFLTSCYKCITHKNTIS
jgi:hypothetical protein